MNEQRFITNSLEEVKEAKKYWANICSKPIEMPSITKDFFCNLDYNKGLFYFDFTGELSNRLINISNGENLTIFTVLLATFNIQLFKYSLQSDLIVGIPVYFKSMTKTNLNRVLVTRNNLDDNLEFKRVLMDLRKTIIETYKNQIVSLEEIFKLINKNDDIMSVLPFNFAMKNIHCKEHIEYIINSPKNEITFLVERMENLVRVEVAYNSKMFSLETIERFSNIYLNILKQGMNNLEIKLSEIEMLEENEKNKLLYKFNNTYANYPKDQTIHGLFEQQVEKMPNKIAVVFEGNNITYKELNEKANMLARNLRQRGINSDNIVAMITERSLDMIIGIIAILKSGGAYLPINPQYPDERIKYMLDNSKADIILTHSTLNRKFDYCGKIVNLDDETIYANDRENLININTPKDLAYIIYTSGTTGNPKGVMIEHKNVVRLMFNEKMQFDFNEKDIWTMFHSYCFDFSVWEMYGALLYGGKLVLISDNNAMDTEKYLKILKEEQVTILNQIPTPFYALMNKELSIDTKDLSLRYIIFGGEALKPEILKDWIKKYPETKLINMYGITETTVHVTYKEIKEEEINKKISNIGKPIPTLTTYIMDKNLKLQPIGVPGEICVGGAGVARGYLNNKELTENKFVYNPYVLEEKIYRSGDLGKMLPNGELEYLGRIDHQVKIRGFRIECGEIENRLLTMEGIKETIVIDRTDNNGDRYLCAYIVSNKELKVEELRYHLSKKLPQYMIPSYFVQIEKMPLTLNGKIDRTSLPNPQESEIIGINYEAPRNDLEERLALAWSEVLGVNKVGINDNFFELGGHSLKATVLVSKIHKELSVEMSIREIFKFPTIKGMSSYIEKAGKSIYSKIEKVEERQYYEASSAQKRMYITQGFDKESRAYNMPQAFEIQGSMDKVKIEDTFKKLVQRHEGLRTYFEVIDGEMVQKVDESYEFKLEQEVSNQSIEEIVNDFVKPFNLGKVPLFRAEIVEGQSKTYLLVDIHHIISDGVSMSILISEFVTLYNGGNLEVLKLQYKDFAIWQNNFLKSEEMKKQEEYWITMFDDEIPVLNIPTDYERPAVQSFEGDSVSFEVDKNVALKLKELTTKTGTTMHMVLLSVFNILLAKYSGQEDIVVGTPIAGRPHADLQNIMGMFVNTLALRNKPEGTKKYVDFLGEVKENSLKAYDNQSYQLEALIEKLDIVRDTSRNPLFDVMFNMVDTVSELHIKLKDMSLIPYDNENNVAKFDLTLNAMEQNGEINISIGYCSKLFNKSSIERLGKHYLSILESIIANNEIKLGEIELLSDEEKNLILSKFNDTKMEYPSDKTIQELFEAQVERTPDNIAVIFENKKLTYRELNEKANSLASVLRNNDVKEEAIVGIMIDRSLEMVIGIIAILKAGGAYLPIDPNYPKERIKYILKDSETKILLTKSELLETIDFEGTVIDVFKDDLFKGEVKNLDKINTSNNLAYVIYTSGTTGNPKGAMIEHRSLVNRLLWMQNKYPLSEEDTILQKTTYTFDVSVWELLWWSLVGAKVCMLSPNDEKDPVKIVETINKHRVTTVHFVPSMLDLFIDYLEESKKASSLISLRQVFSSGETLNFKQVSRFYKELGNSKNLINLYGPTEATIDVSYFETTNYLGMKVIPIGKPISNIKLYILDSNRKLQPIGVAGELYIAGDGLARGYLNKPELTAEKFVDNPFEQGTKMYKTGDLVRWSPDGNIEFLGRIDNQVKIRGFRIELGEIESRILQHGDVKEVAVVVIDGKDNDKSICSYIVSYKELNELNLRDYLKESLPEYMIPAYFVKLEKMPITTNGKLDRRALPKPNLDERLTSYEAPTNALEETLARVWSEILAIQKIGINDSFFELGGHSLKAMTLISKIHKETNKEVPLKELFKSPTIKGLSKFIEEAEESIYSKIEKVEEREYYEASSAQKRMYVIQGFDKESMAYNMPQVFEIQGSMDKVKIEDTFKKLVQRHEALRTYFEVIDGEIVQKIDNSYQFKLDQKVSNQSIEEIANDFVKPFDLGKAPLFRAEIVEGQSKNYLLIDMHHIISDGVSMSILINEFVTLYNGGDLEALKLQYKDFAVWQNNFLKSEDMKKQEEYWINMFKDEIPVLNMATDYERPAIQSFEGDSVSCEVDKNVAFKLKELTKKTETTMHMVLLSAFNILLSKYSGQEDIVVGTPIAGRPHADLQNIMGMFVNTLALRNKPEGTKKYVDFLREVKENSLKAYDNQSYQLETLIEKIDIVRDTSRNPLFDVMFNMVDTVANIEVGLNDIELIPYGSENNEVKFDLTLNVMEQDNEITINIGYCSKLFNKSNIDRLGKHYLSILESITENNEIKIKDIQLLSNEENNKILYEFNDTKAEYPIDKTIHELFEEQVEKTPNNIAVEFEDNQITYRQLNEKANSLATMLREKGVGTDHIVSIMAERSIDMIVGIIAILKAGGAYLPIDPKQPKDRIRYTLEECEVKLLLTQTTFIKDIDYDVEIIDLQDEKIYTKEKENLKNISNSSNLAYIIYTSGSTGLPKGVMIEHKGVVRLAKNTNYISVDSKDIILQLSNYAFDGSVFDIYGALLNGAKLVLIAKDNLLEIDKLGKVILDKKVSVFFVTTALFNTIVDSKIECLRNVRKVLFGGERISVKHAKKALEYLGSKHIVHVYGPTEGTVYTTYHFIDTIENDAKNIPIGKSISNSTAYVLGKSNELLPIGIPGELCIGGDGIARGYLKRPELTDEKFINNPFKLGDKIYKTGDLVRWLPDGSIEFLGRIDNQVKIRGFRIELGEIENSLLTHKHIKGVAVTVEENEEKEKYICAYVVSEQLISNLNLRSYLKETLPEYMIPTFIIQVENIELTPNGKLDKRSLPKPDLEVCLNNYEAPRNDLEETLVKIWSEVLGVEKIGINDSFFELGGHSLKAMTLISKIHKETNKEVPLKELFKSPTIKGLSKFIEEAEESIYSKIKKVEEREHYEASSAQKRMYIIQGFDKESMAYNMPQVFEIKGFMDKVKIEDTFKKLVQRHEVLRTYFEVINGEIVQKIDKSYEFKLALEVSNQSIEEIVNGFVIPFDLSKAPLFRAQIVETQSKNYLLIDMHHIISDGVSMSIIINEFVALYNGGTLESLKLQYKDFAAWQNNFLKSEEIKKQEEYWTNMFDDEIPVLNIPTDYERPAVQSFEGNSVSFEVDKKVVYELKSLSKNTGTTMHMVLLSAFNILLSKYSGQENIVVGTPIAGRPHDDLQNIMGMFVNTLALRNKPEGTKKYVDFLNEVKENSLKAYENQSYQLEALIEKLHVVRDTSRNPLFDVMFNMVDTVSNLAIKLNDTSLIPYGSENNVAKFDLTLNAMEQNDEINISIGYCSKLFNKSSIERLGKHYLSILETIIANNEIKLREIDLLSNDEENLILSKFNDMKMEYPSDKTIQELFEEQVEKIPDNIAVICEDKKLTYRELNEKANRLARVLRNKGIKADSIVAIMVDRSLEMIIGMLGVLKAGGAYLPIDPTYPKQRIEYMLKDSGSEVLLTEKALINTIDFNGKIIDLLQAGFLDMDGENLDKINNETNLAYVIYTSGTTGNPKGVMIKHSNLNNFIMSLNKVFSSSIGFKDKVLSLTNYVFDVSVCEIFVSLTNGATLVINDKHKTFDPAEISRLIVENEITFTYIPPLLLTNVYEELNKSKRKVKLNKLLVGVEAIRGKTLNKFYELNKDIEIINGYGPTETTICSTFYKVDGDEIDDKAVSIGKPIGNTKIYILNNNKLQPIGVPGELCISGNGLSNGYLNKPELTAEKFVDNPFDLGTKMYKTGDLARWLEDGDIEFLGRIDSQVKIRGFRVELGEIENAILKCSGVKQTVVDVRERETGEKYLIAFVEGNEVDEINIRKELRSILPNYMRPDFIVEVDKMPITTRGKLDRKALQQLEKLSIKREEYVEVKTETEKIIADIWKELLNLDSISSKDSFFEIGGNSLLVINMVGKIQKQIKIELEISDIYKHPILEELAEIIDRKKLNFEEIKEEVILLRKGNNKQSKKLIFVHGGSGSIGGYANLFREDKFAITENYDVYAIKFDKLKNCAPMEITINELANEYGSIIEKYFRDETIVLGGWCIGGLIITEMAKVLEKKKINVEKLLIFNSIAPRKWKDRFGFNLESETEYLKGLVDFDFLEKIVSEAENVEELWKLMLPTITESTEILDKIPKALLESIPNYKMLKTREVIYYLNSMRTLHSARVVYIPKEKIKTKVYYFNPLRDSSINDKKNNVRVWQKYCKNKIEVLNINGDEHTIFDEDIKDTITKINEAILES